MNVKQKNYFDGYNRPVSVAGAVQGQLEYSLYEGGRLEAMADNIRKLQEAMIAVVGMLPEDKQLEFLNEISSGWERAE